VRAEAEIILHESNLARVEEVTVRCLVRIVAVERSLTTLSFFWNSTGTATGHIDSAFLLAGALVAGAYFDAGTAEEREICGLADALYRRRNWTYPSAEHRG
jgi:hypothetical protein